MKNKNADNRKLKNTVKIKRYLVDSFRKFNLIYIFSKGSWQINVAVKTFN